MARTVLITGANRGIGLKLVELYKAKSYQVIAAVRDISKMSKVKDVIVVKISSDSLTDAKEAVELLQKKHGIKQLDIVIANAAVNPSSASFKDTDMKDLDEAFRVNVRGPLVLFQAVLPLLDEKTSKFVCVSSRAGIIDKVHRSGQSVYGQSKSALNFMVAKLHAEHPDLVVLAVHPGWIETDMGNESAEWFGVDKVPDDINLTLREFDPDVFWAVGSL